MCCLFLHFLNLYLISFQMLHKVSFPPLKIILLFAALRSCHNIGIPLYGFPLHNTCIKIVHMYTTPLFPRLEGETTSLSPSCAFPQSLLILYIVFTLFPTTITALSVTFCKGIVMHVSFLSTYLHQ